MKVKITDEIRDAQHRVSMKRSLRLAGCPVDNGASTEMLKNLCHWVEAL